MASSFLRTFSSESAFMLPRTGWPEASFPTYFQVGMVIPASKFPEEIIAGRIDQEQKILRNSPLVLQLGQRPLDVIVSVFSFLEKTLYVLYLILGHAEAIAVAGA